ncbi:hypothetical protein JYT83_01520 [bacterium AH-315-F18]|nr:hypothetical protein [bacterium AH-315-F18]
MNVFLANVVVTIGGSIAICIIATRRLHIDSWIATSPFSKPAVLTLSVILLVTSFFLCFRSRARQKHLGPLTRKFTFIFSVTLAGAATAILGSCAFFFIETIPLTSADRLAVFRPSDLKDHIGNYDLDDGVEYVTMYFGESYRLKINYSASDNYYPVDTTIECKVYIWATAAKKDRYFRQKRNHSDLNTPPPTGHQTHKNDEIYKLGDRSEICLFIRQNGNYDVTLFAIKDNVSVSIRVFDIQPKHPETIGAMFIIPVSRVWKWAQSRDLEQP